MRVQLVFTFHIAHVFRPAFHLFHLGGALDKLVPRLRVVATLALVLVFGDDSFQVAVVHAFIGVSVPVSMLPVIQASALPKIRARSKRTSNGISYLESRWPRCPHRRVL